MLWASNSDILHRRKAASLPSAQADTNLLATYLVQEQWKVGARYPLESGCALPA